MVQIQHHKPMLETPMGHPLAPASCGQKIQTLNPQPLVSVSIEPKPNLQTLIALNVTSSIFFLKTPSTLLPLPVSLPHTPHGHTSKVLVQEHAAYDVTSDTLGKICYVHLSISSSSCRDDINCSKSQRLEPGEHLLEARPQQQNNI
jgi:hypothetical protein